LTGPTACSQFPNHNANIHPKKKRKKKHFGMDELFHVLVILVEQIKGWVTPTHMGFFFFFFQFFDVAKLAIIHKNI